MANIHQAKTNLSALLQHTLAGEDVIIAKSGQPVARLIPFEKNENKRIAGLFQGKISMSPHFFEPSPEIENMFAGEEE